MAKDKKEKKDIEEEKDVKDEENSVEKDVEETKVPKNKNVAIVEWRGNIREYSKEIHGDNFLDLAKEFAIKVNGEVK